MSIALTVLAVGLLAVVFPRTARAESPNPKATPIYVLSILTDDADDQADALTSALRTRVRQASGVSLLETPQSLETLTIALRCPPKPDGPCLQRIGDQLHADHYVWGTLAKKKGGEVQAEMHFWSRGKPQVEASATFSDNLKEPGDDALKSVAAKLLGELTNAGSGGGGSEPAGAEGATGTLIVHAGSGGGTVKVDGVEKGTLEGGTAKVEVSEGPHKITVHVPGFQAPSLTTSVKAGNEQEVSFALAPGQDEENAEAEGPSKPFPTRKVIGWTGVGIGAVLAVVAVVEVAGWFSDKADSDNQRNNIPANVSDACSVGPAVPYAAAASAACNDSNDAKTKSTVAWITGGAGLAFAGVGAFLLATDHDSSGDGPSPSAAARNLKVAPMVGPHEGGLRLQLKF